MTVLDLNDWMGDPVPGKPVSLCLGFGLLLGMIAIFIGVGCLKKEEDDWIVVHTSAAPRYGAAALTE